MEKINDSRYFLNFLNQVSDNHPDSMELVESVRKYYIKENETITDSQKQALKTLPVQFVSKIRNKDGWTTALHIWAEQGVREILDIDPLILSAEDSLGYTVLHSFVKYCLGTYTNEMDYDAIELLLSKDMNYELVTVDPDSKEFEVEEKHCIQNKDINGKSYIDYLIDFAWSLDCYDGLEPDEKLKFILKAQTEKDN